MSNAHANCAGNGGYDLEFARLFHLPGILQLQKHVTPSWVQREVEIATFAKNGKARIVLRITS